MFKDESDFLKYKCVECGDISHAEDINEIIDSEKKCSYCRDLEASRKLEYYKKQYKYYLSLLTSVTKFASDEYIVKVINGAKKLIVTLENMVVSAGGCFITLIKNLKAALANLIARTKLR